MEKFIKKRIGRIVRLESNDNSLIKAKLPKYTKSIDCVVDLGIKDGLYYKRVNYTYYSPVSYEALVNQLVKERYSDSDEFAILRKAINGITDEYHIYNTYVEECKVRAKEFIQERNKILEE